MYTAISTVLCVRLHALFRIMSTKYILIEFVNKTLNTVTTIYDIFSILSSLSYAFNKVHSIVFIWVFRIHDNQNIVNHFFISNSTDQEN